MGIPYVVREQSSLVGDIELIHAMCCIFSVS